MTNFSLDFLDQDFSLAEVQAPTSKQRPSKEYNPNPEFQGIRLHGDGSVYPSRSLATMLSLEYSKVIPNAPTLKLDAAGNQVLDADGNPIMNRTFDDSQTTCCGLDVIDSNAWGAQYPASAPRCVFVGVVFKRLPKVDLFKQCRYSEDGSPIASVMDQGANTYGKEELIPLIKEVYGVEVAKDGYVDLEVVMTKNLKKISPNGLFFIPKKITRGKDAGKADYVTRENIDIYPLVPMLVSGTEAHISAPAGSEIAQEATTRPA